MTPSLWRSALVLGLLSMVGPFAIDMYLPAMPEIVADFDVSERAIQVTITAYFIGFGLAQMVYGPWADQAGRKLPIYIGLIVFLAGAAGAALAGTAVELTAWRFLQGLGAAALMVLPRAIIRDLYTGAEATRLMALIMLVISISPMLAPLAGSFVVPVFGWRAIFVLIGIGALLSLAVTGAFLSETLPKTQRVPFNLRALVQGMRTLILDRQFLALTFVGAFGMASFFVFIASAAFVYRDQYGLGPTEFALAFAVNAVGFFGACQLAGPLAERFGLTTVVRIGTAFFAASATILLALLLTTEVHLFVVIGFLLCANAGFGLALPTTMVMALDEHGAIAGLASSFGGTLQMLTGGLMIVATGPFFDGTAIPMVAVIALCACASFVLTLIVRTRF